jgi:hypothetical protein
MEGTYMIQVVEDGAVSFSRKYDNALDAVHAFDRFHGLRVCQVAARNCPGRAKRQGPREVF